MSPSSPLIDLSATRPPEVGPLGRLGRWTATHFRRVLVTWALLAIVLGTLAPRVETALSGAGWEATGSESVRARTAIDEHFGGAGTYGLTVAVHAPGRTVADPVFTRTLHAVEAELARTPAVRGGLERTVAPDRRTVLVH